MKKTQYIHSIAVLVAASFLITACQKEEDKPDTVNLIAYADEAPDGGKAYVSSNYICWNDNDEVNINNDTYRLSVSGASEDDASATIPNVTAINEGYYTAAYPAGNVTALSSGSVTINVPAIQTYTTQSSPGGTKQVVEMPMVGQGPHDGGSIHFHNAAALIKVTVSGAQKVYKIEVSADASAKLCGSGTVNPATGELTSGITGGNIVTLDCSSYPDAGDFYLVVEPFTNKNVTVTVWATGVDNKKYIGTKTSSEPKTLGRNKMGAVTVAVNDDGSGPCFWGGDGLSDENPWLITSKEDLTALRTNVNAGTSYSGNYFLQTANIDASETAWTPIGTSSNKFSGNYDGGNHSVTLDFKPTANHYGFFGCVNSAVIKNTIVTGTYNEESTAVEYVGSFCGEAIGTSTFDNCENQIALNNTANYTGGICGAINGGTFNFINCSNDAESTVGSYAGGIVGRIYGTVSATLTNCENNQPIGANNKNQVGGIIGEIAGSANITINGTTTNSGSVNTIDGVRCGGIIGSITITSGRVTIGGNVSNFQPVSGSYNIGGIIGYIERGQLLSLGTNSTDRISNEGDIITPENNLSKGENVGTGGIIGCSAMGSSLTVQYCRNSGAIKGRRNYYSSRDYGYVGGIVGYSISSVTMDYCSNEGTLYIWNNGNGKWLTTYATMKALVGGATAVTTCSHPYPAP